MTSRLLTTTAAVLAGVALLAACGGGDDDASDGQIASLGTTTTVAPATTTPAASAASDDAASPPDAASSADVPSEGSEVVTLSSDPEQAALDYVECIRDHGIDMPDPQPGGGILIQQGEAESGEAGTAPAFDDQAFVDADEECQKYMEAAMGSMELDPEQEAEMQANMLEYAQCIRDHGVDMPDPQFDADGRVSMQIGDGDGGQPMDQEEFEAANEACGQEGGGIAIGAAPAGGE